MVGSTGSWGRTAPSANRRCDRSRGALEVSIDEITINTDNSSKSYKRLLKTVCSPRLPGLLIDERLAAGVEESLRPAPCEWGELWMGKRNGNAMPSVRSHCMIVIPNELLNP